MGNQNEDREREAKKTITEENRYGICEVKRNEGAKDWGANRENEEQRKNKGEEEKIPR